MHSHRLKKSYCGMTLTECLVAVTILGILAMAVVPSVGLLNKITAQRDVRQRVMGSWQMAMALASARQQPVIWQFKNLSNHQTQISLLSHQREDLWQIQLDVALGIDSQEIESKAVFERTVSSHGMTDPFVIRWQQDSQTQQMNLGEPRDAAVVGGQR